MPLPTAPTKRAALLSLQDFNVPARPKAKGSSAKPQASKPSDIPQKALIQQAPLPTPAIPTIAPQAAPIPPKRRREATSGAQTVARTKRRMEGPSKLFVLDTNVLLHDPSCLFRFEEHDVFYP
jgi:PhoH-like ATPase